MTLRYFIDANKKEWFSLKAISDMLRLDEAHVHQIADNVKEEHKCKVDVRQVTLACYGGVDTQRVTTKSTSSLQRLFKFL